LLNENNLSLTFSHIIIFNIKISLYKELAEVFKI
jgi:hypothetical protein